MGYKHRKSVLHGALKLSAAARAIFAFLFGLTLDYQMRVIHAVKGGKAFTSKSVSNHRLYEPFLVC